MIHEAAQHWTDLVQDLTDLSTFRGQNTHLDNEWFTMADVISDVIEQHASQLWRKGLEVIVEEAEPDLQILSDRKRARQAFMHLMAYAIQSSEQGRIRLTYARRFGQLEVNILDVGQNVSANQLAGLEEALHQSGGARHDWDPYVGLYIYLARELVRLLGGRIDVARASERRLRFKITLPLAHS
jgi:K+-sensing histidine kinase KdpD